MQLAAALDVVCIVMNPVISPDSLVILIEESAGPPIEKLCISFGLKIKSGCAPEPLTKISSLDGSPYAISTACRINSSSDVHSHELEFHTGPTVITLRDESVELGLDITLRPGPVTAAVITIANMIIIVDMPTKKTSPLVR